MSSPIATSARCALSRARPARVTAVAAALVTAVGFAVTLFSAMSACPVNFVGGLLTVGAGRPLLSAVHVHVEHRSWRRRPRVHHQPFWSATAVAMLVAGCVLTLQAT